MTQKNKYKSPLFWVKTILSSFVLSAVIVPHASAHLMVSQHGTLNFKGDGVFMVLSLPVSAFKNIDDDGDGKMSNTEFSKHQPVIVKAVNENVSLQDENGPKALQGLMLSPVASHSVVSTPANQIIVMGRFSLPDSNRNIRPTNSSGLKFHLGLFGKNAGEKEIEITATRQSEADKNPQKYKMVLTPEEHVGLLFTKT